MWINLSEYPTVVNTLHSPTDGCILLTHSKYAHGSLCTKADKKMAKLSKFFDKAIYISYYSPAENSEQIRGIY